MSKPQEDYILIGTDLTDMRLQAGFVEGIISEHKRFATLAGAFRHIFRRNLEFAILLWNGLPVGFSYPNDLSAMVDRLIEMLYTVQHPAAQSGRLFEFKTPNLQFRWQIETSAEDIVIASTWNQVPGNYEAALNRLGMVRMPRLTFLCEWKLLLQQLSRAMGDAEAVLTRREARTRLETLRSIEAGIPSLGSFYRYLK